MTYGYNGLGDQVSQTSGGTTTRYALDQEATYTQVLTDGSATYLYGNGRIGQVGANNRVDYMLGDALGSVRQLASSAGEVTLSRSYTPYGDPLLQSGSSASAGYTGEQQQDALLRAGAGAVLVAGYVWEI